MRLLVITQKMDKNDPILGFFHQWILEFSKRFEKVTVICLEEGVHVLPENVRILSLGKETRRSRLQYIRRFYAFIWRERKTYDSVFVHMNQEYVLLGGLIWKILQKKILLWRNHPYGTFLTRVAVALSDTVFCTSPQAFTARFNKTVLMPVGIDTGRFKRDENISRDRTSLLYVGRISSIKKVDVLIEALDLLRQQGVSFSVTIVGEPAPWDMVYAKTVRERAHALVSSGNLVFAGTASNEDLPAIYSKHAVLVNLTPSGSLDKVIFEAMACGVVPIVSNVSLLDVLPDGLVMRNVDPETITQTLRAVLTGKINCETMALRQYVVEKHSLTRLADLLPNYV